MSGPFSCIRSTVCPALGDQPEPPASPYVTRSSLESNRGRRDGPERREHRELPVQRPCSPTWLVGEQGRGMVTGGDPRFRLSEVGPGTALQEGGV